MQSKILCYRCVLFLPITREGNVFRSVCLSTGKGVSASEGGLHLKRGSLQGGKAASKGGLPNPPVLTSSGGHSSGWYASYWNAFL